ncbi:hypothetical protein [Sphingomonas crocodyli]|uniref:Uncharacterized protein n=1 Tax=Sphingomonas crocodyli TaxID=1979270 RepID=A0A437M6U5_9SPHN|nr:hypothetical protein [Sphingomonas crocodyli]RVT93431.1 hypothetical protein EOD43_06020 [Sphingomonas crocodyli]
MDDNIFRYGEWLPQRLKRGDRTITPSELARRRSVVSIDKDYNELLRYSPPARINKILNEQRLELRVLRALYDDLKMGYIRAFVPIMPTDTIYLIPCQAWPSRRMYAVGELKNGRFSKKRDDWLHYPAIPAWAVDAPICFLERDAINWIKLNRKVVPDLGDTRPYATDEELRQFLEECGPSLINLAAAKLELLASKQLNRRIPQKRFRAMHRELRQSIRQGA